MFKTRLGKVGLKVIVAATLVMVAPKCVVAQARETGTVPEIARPEDAQTSRSKTAVSPGDRLDINSASKDQLAAISDIGEAYAQKIIAGRPYRTKRDLLTRKIIPRSMYEKINDQVIAHRSTAKSSEPEKHN
jgi:competence protein ComEA